MRKAAETRVEMTDSHSDKPARRPRYRGTHPRQFQEKYKERQPERYPDAVAKVLDGGKTPAGTHRPIMVPEVLNVLALNPGDVAVDCTLGYGGHARELLRAVQPGGRLLGFDVDPVELPKAEARLRESGIASESLKLWRKNFAGIARILAVEAPGGVDAVFADLGVSSMQLDDPTRGFTYKADGPLDMRMNPSRGLSAAELLSKLDADELSDLLADNADEPLSGELADAILTAHARQPLNTTRALADVVRTTITNKFRFTNSEADAAVRRVFQALRIAVNDEFGALDALLRQLPLCLKPGGRAAILTFHSGEDRRVKVAFKQGLRDGAYSDVARDVLRASAEEQRTIRDRPPRSCVGRARRAVSIKHVGKPRSR